MRVKSERKYVSEFVLRPTIELCWLPCWVKLTFDDRFFIVIQSNGGHRSLRRSVSALSTATTSVCNVHWKYENNFHMNDHTNGPMNRQTAVKRLEVSFLIVLLFQSIYLCSMHVSRAVVFVREWFISAGAFRCRTDALSPIHNNKSMGARLRWEAVSWLLVQHKMHLWNFIKNLRLKFERKEKFKFPKNRNKTLPDINSRAFSEYFSLFEDDLCACASARVCVLYMPALDDRWEPFPQSNGAMEK